MDALDAVCAMDESLALEVCLAVRQNKLEAAQATFEKILVVQEDKEFLALIKLALLAALRKEQELMALHWLEASKKRLKAAFAKAELAEEEASLLETWCFACCDHRLENMRVALTSLVRQWFRATGSSTEAQALEKELLNMAARMVRRGWQQEARWLLRLLAWRVLRCQSLDAWQRLLAQLSLHFTVYARWDGFAKACEAYAELVLLLVVLVRRAKRDAQRYQQAELQAHRKPLTEQQRAAALKLALRTVRDLVTTIARTSMQDDMDIFRQWYQYLWQLAGDDQLKKQQLMLLLQLAIRYWQRTLPKSSKKQVRFLQDLLEPSFISAEYEALLEKVA